MKQKILILLFALLPFFLIAQEENGGWGNDNESVQDWVTDHGNMDEYFVNIATFEFLNRLITDSSHHITAWMDIAKALASIFAMLAISLEGFKMLSMDGSFSFMPIVRPFVLGMVIFNWASFISIVSSPGMTMQKVEEQNLALQFHTLNELTHQRYTLMDEMSARLNTLEKDFIAEASEGESAVARFMGKINPFGNIISDIRASINVFNGRVKMWGYLIIQNIANFFFQVGIYGLLFLQYSFMLILGTVGSLVFAFSMIPAFKDLWSAWLMRFLSVTFWGAIGYLVLKLGLAITHVNLKSNVEFLTDALGNEPDIITTGIITYTQTGGMDLSILIASLMSMLSLLIVPTISAWIFNTSSVGAASKIIVGAALAMAGGATKIAKGAAGGGSGK